jgi:hypothetical protein
MILPEAVAEEDVHPFNIYIPTISTPMKGA